MLLETAADEPYSEGNRPCGTDHPHVDGPPEDLHPGNANGIAQRAAVPSSGGSIIGACRNRAMPP